MIQPPASTLVLQGISGYDQVVAGMSTGQVGDGFENIRGYAHVRAGIVNNVVANSRQLFRLDAAELFGQFWDAPLVVNFRFHEFLLAAEGHVGVCIGEWPSVGPPHTNARTDTTVRRLQYIAERDASGTITHSLVTCDGAARSETIIGAPSINDKISLLWRTDPRAFEYYVNGALVRRETSILPARADAGRFLAGYAVWKVPASAVRNHLRLYAFGVMAGQQSI